MKEVLKKYMTLCGATTKDLSMESGIALSTLSRYLSGIRVPKEDGEHVEMLVKGLCSLLESRASDRNISMEEVKESLLEGIRSEKKTYDYDVIRENLRKLMLEFGLSANSLADEIYYSVSSLSRFMSGSSTPRDIDVLVDSVVKYVVDNIGKGDNAETISNMLMRECGSTPAGQEETNALLRKWLLGEYIISQEEASEELLSKIDEFDYEEYMANIDVKAVEKIPVTKRKLPVTKRFSGQEGMEAGIMDFLKATVTSASKEDIFVFSDHPIEHLSNNPETVNNWIKAVGASVLQGKKIQILHNLNRPIEEMVLGLTSWLPLYMTGMVKSYYMPNTVNSPFKHILMVSGGAVFSGYSVSDIMAESSYIFSKAMPKISEGRKSADTLLEQSKVLVEAYDERRAAEYREFVKGDSKNEGNRISYSDSLPVFTLTDSLLESIAEKNEVSEENLECIKNYLAEERVRIEKILGRNKIHEVFQLPQPDEHGNCSVVLVPDGCEERLELAYGGADYEEHLMLCEKYAETHENYQFLESKNQRLKKTKIVIREGGSMIVSRSRGRELHLVINYPLLVNTVTRIFKEAAEGRIERVGQNPDQK